MQPEATYRSGGSGSAASGTPNGAPSAGNTQSQPPKEGTSPQACAMNAGLMGLMVVMMYFLIIRPQRKQQKAQEVLLKSLKRGSFVRTSGGIRGEVMEVNDKDVMLMIAEKVKINVLKTHVTLVETGTGV